MTQRKYSKLHRKISSAIALINDGEDTNLKDYLNEALNDLTGRYGDQFTAEFKRGERQPKEVVPKTHEVAFVQMGEDVKYGFREIATGEGSFDFMKTSEKSKKLQKLIQEAGADVIQIRIGSRNTDVGRAHKLAEKTGYKIELEGNHYIMVKQKVEAAPVEPEIKN
jgi:hypothetical protein